MLQQWNMERNDKKNNGQKTLFLCFQRKPAVLLVILGLLNYHQLGMLYMHVETSDNNSVDEIVLVSFERKEFIRISFLVFLQSIFNFCSKKVFG